MKRKAFTLIELLVVITIIMLLIALLIPSLGLLKDKGRQLQCLNNQKQLAGAIITFAEEHRQILPASMKPGPDLTWQYTWVGLELLNSGDAHGNGTWPKQTGALVRAYVKDADTIRKLMRCPGTRVGQLRSGVGSNGRFDYAMIESFGGANITRIPTQAQVYFNGVTNRYPTPLVVGEDPYWGINRNNIEPSHGNSDKLAYVHSRNRIACFASIDSSAHSVDRRGAKDTDLPDIKTWYVLLNGKRTSLWSGKPGPNDWGVWNNL